MTALDFSQITDKAEIAAAAEMLDQEITPTCQLLFVPSENYGQLFVVLSADGFYQAEVGNDGIYTKDRAEALAFAVANA